MMLQSMLLSASVGSRPNNKSLDRGVSANLPAEMHRPHGNFGQVVGGCSFVRAFSWRLYEKRAMVGRQTGGYWLATGRFLGGNHRLVVKLHQRKGYFW